MITEPRSSLIETKSGRKESSFPAEMPLIKSVGARVSNSESSFALDLALRRTQHVTNTRDFYFLHVLISPDWLNRFRFLLTTRTYLGGELSCQGNSLFLLMNPWKFSRGNFTLGKSVKHKKILPRG